MHRWKEWENLCDPDFAVYAIDALSNALYIVYTDFVKKNRLSISSTYIHYYSLFKNSMHGLEPLGFCLLTMLCCTYVLHELFTTDSNATQMTMTHLDSFEAKLHIMWPIIILCDYVQLDGVDRLLFFSPPMKFHIDNLPVSFKRSSFSGSWFQVLQIIFPYDRIYPGTLNSHGWSGISHELTIEQYAYMCDLKRTLDTPVG